MTVSIKGILLYKDDISDADMDAVNMRLLNENGFISENFEGIPTESLFIVIHPKYFINKDIINIISNSYYDKLFVIGYNEISDIEHFIPIENILMFINLATLIGENEGSTILAKTITFILQQLQRLKKLEFKCRFKYECKKVIYALGYHLFNINPTIYSQDSFHFFHLLGDISSYMNKSVLLY